MLIGVGLNASEGMPFIKNEDRFKHLLCLGSTGMGKSTFLANLFKNELNNACIVLDPNGSLIEAIAPIVPQDRLVYVDKNNPISLNPLSRKHLNWSEHSKELIQVVNAAVKEIAPRQAEVTALMTRLVKNALRVFKPEQMNLEYLIQFLDKADERKKFKDDHFWKNFDKGNWEARDSSKRVTARLSLYYDDLDLRPFLVGENEFDISEIVKEKKIVLFNLDKLDDEATSFLGFLVTTQIKSYYMHLAEKSGDPLFFYCDEFHLFINEEFGRFLAEGRKYNISFNFGGHSFSLLNEFFRAMLLSCHTKVILHNEGDDADVLAKSFQVKATDISTLKPFNAIARIGSKNHSVRLFPPLVTNNTFTKPKTLEDSKDGIEEQLDLNFICDTWVDYGIIKN